MAKAPILVTGSNGQVGRACVAALSKNGADVLAVSRDGAHGREAIDLSGSFENGLAQVGTGGRAVPGVIVHLAAAVPHDPRYPDDHHSAAITTAIDRHVCEAAIEWGSRIVYMSTCAVYDRLDPCEKSPHSPLATSLSPYALAKSAGELLFAEQNAVIFRLSAPAGAGSRSNLVFGRFAELCRAGKPIELWGLGAREQDFIDIDDICDLVRAAVSSEVTGTFNCARGRAVTMIELAEAVLHFYGQGSIIYSGRMDPLEGETAHFNISDTTKAFGWLPWRGLADMLQSFEGDRLERCVS